MLFEIFGLSQKKSDDHEKFWVCLKLNEFRSTIKMLTSLLCTEYESLKGGTLGVQTLQSIGRNYAEYVPLTHFLSLSFSLCDAHAQCEPKYFVTFGFVKGSWRGLLITRPRHSRSRPRKRMLRETKNNVPVIIVNSTLLLYNIGRSYLRQRGSETSMRPSRSEKILKTFWVHLQLWVISIRLVLHKATTSNINCHFTTDDGVRECRGCQRSVHFRLPVSLQYRSPAGAFELPKLLVVCSCNQLLSYVSVALQNVDSPFQGAGTSIRLRSSTSKFGSQCFFFS